MVWAGWLVICAVVSCSIAAPLPARLALCVALALSNVPAIRRCVLLRGVHAVRALEWQEQGGFTVLLGATLCPYPAELAAGSFRLGGFALLRLRTTIGMRSVLIDGGLQAVSEFRRLCRCLEGNRAARSGRSREPAVTIRPKV